MRETGFDEVKKDLQSIKSINPVADVAEDIQKQNDDFKKYFGDASGNPVEPAKAKQPAEAKAEPSPADNEFDKYFAKTKSESVQS